MTLRQNLVFPAKALSAPGAPPPRWGNDGALPTGGFRGPPPQRSQPAQRLRCAVARALIAVPTLLLIDERAFDAPLFQQVRAAFAGPILLVTGDLDLCCAVADEVIVLVAGRIVERGTPRAVLDRPASVEIARLLGIPNLFQATIAALDPARDSSRLEFAQFA